MMLSELLSDAFDGNPWYGDSLMDQVKDLTHEQAAQRPIDGKKSIWELLLHLLAWRDFAIRKLRGEDDFEIELNTPWDFPPLPMVNATNWQEILTELRASQKTLLSLIQAFPAEKWPHIMPGRNYSYEHLIHGIVQHDCYHLGQIGMLKSLLK